VNAFLYLCVFSDSSRHTKGVSVRKND